MARFATLQALNVNDNIPDAWVDEVKAAHDWLIVAGANLASATTLTVTNEFHQVTGTTTIDNITDASTASAGQQVRLLFQGALTVRNNGGGTGNIRTITGGDLTVLANEVRTFVYDGTVWREFSAQPPAPPMTALSGKSFNTASLTEVMCGWGGLITPVRTGRIDFIYRGSWASAGANQVWAGIRYGTGSAPAAGAAVTGTLVHQQQLYNGTGAAGMTLVLGDTISGLTKGTQYWFDGSLYVNTSNTTLSGNLRALEV